MPVEIRELVIRATIEEAPQARSGSRAQGAGAVAAGARPGAAADRAHLVEECVEQVMEILRQRQER